MRGRVKRLNVRKRADTDADADADAADATLSCRQLVLLDGAATSKKKLKHTVSRGRYE